MERNAYRTLLAAAVVAASIVGRASAAPLFSDDFEGRTNGNHLNANGPLVSSWGPNYTVTPNNTSSGYTTEKKQETVEAVPAPVNSNAGVLRDGAALINTSFAGTGYTVSFNFARAAGGGYTGIFFGASASDVGTAGTNGFAPFVAGYSGNVDNGYLFQNSGNLQRVSFGGTGINYASSYSDTTGYASVHSALVTVNAPGGFGAGSPITYSISIDGNAIPAATATINSDGGPASIGFASGNAQFGFIDNIVVTAVPEPATFAALAGAGLCLAARRRRPAAR